MAEISKPQESVVAIIRESKRFLLIKRSRFVESAKGYWCPISGRVEDGESQEDAVKREVKEEVGLDLEAHKKVKRLLSADKKYMLNFWTTRNHSGSIKLEPAEVEDFKWLTVGEMRSLQPMFKEDIEIMKSITDSDDKNSLLQND